MAFFSSAVKGTLANNERGISISGTAPGGQGAMTAVTGTRVQAFSATSFVDTGTTNTINPSMLVADAGATTVILTYSDTHKNENFPFERLNA